MGYLLGIVDIVGNEKCATQPTPCRPRPTAGHVQLWYRGEV